MARRSYHSFTSIYSGAPFSFKDQGKGGAVEIVFDDRGAVFKRTLHRVTRLDVHDLDFDISGYADFGEIERRMDALLAPLKV